jgi:hypothetical protein
LRNFGGESRVVAFGASAPVRMEMKNAVSKTLMTLGLVLLVLAPAYAQKTSATVNIPFSFTVDDVEMPAGEYVISSLNERVITLQHVGGREAKTAMTENGSSTNSDGSSKVVFHKYGNAYFLAAAWLPNSDHAREFFASAKEIQVAHSGRQDIVELALLMK